MKNEFVRKAISTELSEQIENMINKIKESFGLELSKIQASRVVAWKSKSYKLNITKERIVDILGGKI